MAHSPRSGWRTFLLTWATQSLSVLGSSLTFFSVSIWLTQTLYPAPDQRADLAFALSAVSLAHTIPMLVSMPLAGAAADRHDRRRTMLFADLINGALTLLLVALLVTGTLRLWGLISVIALLAVASTFHNSAFDASYAMLVPERLLPRANGMMLTMWSLAGILAPALAAVIISVPALARQGLLGGTGGALLGSLPDGVPLVVALDALSFLIAGITLLFLTIPSPVVQNATKAHRRSLWRDMGEGALFIWDRRPMLWLLGTFAIVNLLTVPVILFQPLLVKFHLAAPGITFESALATISSVSSLGGVVGGVLISAWGGLKRNRVYGVVLSALVVGVANAFLGFSSGLYAMAGLAFLSRMMFPLMDAHSQAIWQAQTPRELQGRVFAVRRTLAQFAGPLGSAVAGAVGGLFNPGVIVSAMSAALALFCLLQLMNPHLRRIDDKEWLDRLAAEANARRLQALSRGRWPSTIAQPRRAVYKSTSFNSISSPSVCRMRKSRMARSVMSTQSRWSISC